MRSRINFVAGRVESNLAESGTCITLAWNIWPPNAVRNAVTNLYPGSPGLGREEIKAFLHYVSATSQVRQFNEIQVGDAIMDFSPKVNLVGRDGLTFLLPTGPDNALEMWTNKPMSSQLARMWDAQQAGVKLYQTVLLRKAA